MNKVMLIGNVGADPVSRYYETGVCVAQVRLATTEKGYTLANGTQVPDRTEWHNVIFWRKTAEIVEKYVRKGDKLFVEGKIQTREWTDKSGVSHRSIDIVADNMEMLSSKNTAAQNVSNPISTSAVSQQTQSDASRTATPVTPSAITPSENDDEYPF